MKRLSISLSLTLTLLALVPVASSATPLTGCADLEGAGTSSSPYLISTPAELMAVSICNAEAGGPKHFKQSTDIVLTGNWIPLESFTGVYDGNYQSISGLNVADPVVNTSAINGGLFRELRGATIKNLAVVANNVHTESYSGIIAALAWDATVENVRVISTGTLEAIYGAGCIFGTAYNDLTLSNIYTDCQTVSQVVGGVVGRAGVALFPVNDLDVSGVYVKGIHRFTSTGGGLFGALSLLNDDASISNFSFAGRLNAPNSETATVGGIIGRLAQAGQDFENSLNASTSPVLEVNRAMIRGVISSELVTEFTVIIAAADYLNSPFRPGLTIGAVGYSGEAYLPKVSFSNVIAGAKIQQPLASYGYMVNVGVASNHSVGTPTCSFHVASPDMDMHEATGFDQRTPTELRSAANFGCLTVTAGAANVGAQSQWFQDPDIFLNDIWDAQYVQFDLHESTLDYGQPSFEIDASQSFSILNSGWNFFPEFSITPALPQGIELDANTGRIVGQSSQAFGPTTYTVTRTSLLGHANQTTQVTLSQTSAPTVQQESAPAYNGPVLGELAPNPVARGAKLTLTGQRLQGVTEVHIGTTLISGSGLVAEATKLVVTIPLQAQLGLQPIVIRGDFGSLSYQNGVTVISEGPRLEVRVTKDGHFKVYVFGVLNQGKLQIKVDGKQIAWIRATNATDPRVLRTTSSSTPTYYMVRTVKNPGSKKVELYQNGKLISAHN